MAVPFKVTDKTQIPEAFASEYVERDGAWYLDATGAIEATRLNEFRDNNRKLKADHDALAARFQGIDPEKYARLTQVEQDLLAGKLTGDAGKLIETKTTEMRKTHEAQVNDLTGKLKTLEATLAGKMINEAGIVAAQKLGLKPGATEFLVPMLQQRFRLENGVPTAYDPNGNAIYNANAEPLSIAEFVATLTKSAPFLFEASTGGGTENKGKGQTGYQGKAFKDMTMTERTALYRDDKATYERIKDGSFPKK